MNKLLFSLGLLALLMTVPQALGSPPPQVTLCHNGSTIQVNSNAVAGHLAHGDYLGECIVIPPPPPENQVTVCHNGNDLIVNESAVQGHLNHGDTLGTCPPPEPEPENQVLICHNGNDLLVNESAVEAHLGHGDYLGACIIIPPPVVCEPPQILEGDVCVNPPDDDDDDNETPPTPKKHGSSCSRCGSPTNTNYPNSMRDSVDNDLIINGEVFSVVPFLTQQNIDAALHSYNQIIWRVTDTDKPSEVVHTTLTLGTSSISIDRILLSNDYVVTETDPDGNLYFVSGSLIRDGRDTVFTFNFVYTGDSTELGFVTWDFDRNVYTKTFILQ